MVSAPVGTGHIVAAERVAAALRRALPADSTVIVDDIGTMLRLGPQIMSPVISGAYELGTSAFHGIPHRIVYHLVDRHPSLAEGGFRATFGGQLRQHVLATDPNIVVSTFHAVSATLSLVLPANIPVISVAPGAGHLNKMWLYGRVAHFIFPELQAYEFALNMGVPPSRASMIANVFAPETSAVPAMDEAREELKLPQGFTILLSFGSSGFGRQGKEFLRLLRMRDAATQVIITPGRKRKSLAAARGYADESTLVTQGWVPLMPYMAAADLVVGKAGWLTLTDASAMGRPTLILDYIKGQEDENVRVACLSGTARHVTPAEAVECVLRYSHDEAAILQDFPAMRPTFQSVEDDRERLAGIVRDVIAAYAA